MIVDPYFAVLWPGDIFCVSRLAVHGCPEIPKASSGINGRRGELLKKKPKPRLVSEDKRSDRISMHRPLRIALTAQKSGNGHYISRSPCLSKGFSKFIGGGVF